MKGEEVTGVDRYCDLCNHFLRGTALYFQGKYYHPYPCFSRAVNIYLAYRRLEKDEKKK